MAQHDITAKFRVGLKGFIKVRTVLKKRTTGIFVPILQEYRYMNGDYYANFLRRKLRPKIRENWPQLLEAGVLILRENARSHIAQTITTLFTDYKWEAPSHPASLTGYESSVFRYLRETEQTAAWPKISYFRNTNSTVIRCKRQLTKWAIKWNTKLPNDMMSRP